MQQLFNTAFLFRKFSNIWYFKQNWSKETTAKRLKRIFNLQVAMLAATWRYSTQLIASFHPHLRPVPIAISQVGMKVVRTKLSSMLRKQTIQRCCLGVSKLRICTFEVIRKPTTAVKEAPETTFRLLEEWAGISENWLFNWKCILIWAYHISEKFLTCFVWRSNLRRFRSCLDGI